MTMVKPAVALHYLFLALFILDALIILPVIYRKIEEVSRWSQKAGT